MNPMPPTPTPAGEDKTPTPMTDLAWDESNALGKLSDRERCEFCASLERRISALEGEELALGRLHGEVGLFAKKQFGISDNLPTAETFEMMAHEIRRLRETSRARLDQCIDGDDLLHRLFKACGKPDTDLGREIQHYMDCGTWDDDTVRESLQKRLAALSAASQPSAMKGGQG